MWGFLFICSLVLKCEHVSLNHSFRRNLSTASPIFRQIIPRADSCCPKATGGEESVQPPPDYLPLLTHSHKTHITVKITWGVDSMVSGQVLPLLDICQKRKQVQLVSFAFPICDSCISCQEFIQRNAKRIFFFFYPVEAMQTWHSRIIGCFVKRIHSDDL